MSKVKPRPKKSTVAPRARQGPRRQRQRLIDACISALHIYGPSRTTVEKVVAIAKMSPGIVRFYFDSKAAMLVASLQFLAAEFEEQVLVPVAKLKSNPVAALELMVDLYLDPDIASPRKVSVWYAFWGEASSRQEYYDICGQKDESFAALVRELIARLIAETSRPQLDPDGVALGLIGALEIMWQDFAFQDEHAIDRAAAKHRCMAYLRSIFPGQFAVPRSAPHLDDALRVAGWAYADPRIHAGERDRVFHRAWAAVGHESEIPRGGDYLTLDIGVERVLVVRDFNGTVHFLRNSCPESPHTLVANRGGRFDAMLECRRHGRKFLLDGSSVVDGRSVPGAGRAGLSVLEGASVGGLLFARSALRGAQPEGPRTPTVWFDIQPTYGLMAVGPPTEVPVAADWKVVVEQWLEAGQHVLEQAPPDGDESLLWTAKPLDGWSARRYLGLVPCAPDSGWRRQFIAPNQLIETRPDGLSVIQAVPVAPGRSLLRRLDYTALAPDDGARAVLYLVRRLAPYARRSALDVAESVQRGLINFGYEIAGRGDSPVAWFRQWLAARLPAMRYCGTV